MMRRVLILDTELDMGGKERVLVQFLSRVDRNRFHFAVCCLKSGGYFKQAVTDMGIPFYDGMLRHRYDGLAFFGLSRVLRAERPDLIYTFSHPNTVIFSYLARKRGLARRMLVSYHAMGDTGGTRQVARYLLPMLRRADALLAVAEIQKDYLAKTEGLPRERICVIHNGVDTTRFHSPEAAERDVVRAQLGIARDELAIVSVASLKPLKRIDAVITAAAELAKTGVAVRVVIIGDGSERHSLEKLATDLGMAARVTFLGLRNDVDRLLKAGDVFVLASRTEAFPNVVLEAMATGLPVIATDVGSVREMVEPDTSALVVAPGDDAALAGALRTLAGDATLRARLGRRGREIVNERFRFDVMCAKREALLESVIVTGKAALP